MAYDIVLKGGTIVDANGDEPVIGNSEHTGAKPGKFARGPGWKNLG